MILRRALPVLVLALLAGCGPAREIGPVTPSFPPPLDAEVRRAQTEIVGWVAGACTPEETAVLTEGMALHAAAVALPLTPGERSLLEGRAKELRTARAGFSLRCRSRIDAWPVGPVRPVIVDSRGLLPVGPAAQAAREPRRESELPFF